MRTFILILVLYGAMGQVALATMPTLTDEPAHKTVRTCKLWAKAQRAQSDAYEMWGILSDGETADEVAYLRLFAYCLTGDTAEIVGFGSSAGFNESYCQKHSDQPICKASAEVGSTGTAKMANSNCAGTTLTISGAAAGILGEAVVKKGKPVDIEGDIVGYTTTDDLFYCHKVDANYYCSTSIDMEAARLYPVPNCE